MSKMTEYASSSSDDIHSHNGVQEFQGPESSKDDFPNLERRSSSNLLRTVSQITEYSVQTGRAAEEIDEEIKHPHDEEANSPSSPKPNYIPFWSKRNADFFKQYFVIIFIMLFCMFGIFSIYWGSNYNRTGRLINLHVLVVVEDDHTLPISRAIIETSISPDVSYRAGWKVQDTFMEEDEIIGKVHDEKYWGAIYINSNNASTDLLEAFQNGSDFNTTGLVKTYYETGRDLNGMNSYVEPAIREFERIYIDILQHQIYPNIISNLTNSEFANLQNSNVLTEQPVFTYTDGAPSSSTVLLAPLQVGLIYIVIITFFQVMWFMKVNGELAQKLPPKKYIFYRMCISQCNFLFLSLGYSAINAAFQLDFNKSWKGGFGVMWMFSFLTMSAVGGANENVGLICFATLPPMMGFWMLFFVISNISATFAPIEVCPQFFRYTYAFPIKNSYELMKVLFFDTTRAHLGRDIGILIAWIALNNALLPVCLIFFSWNTKRKLTAAAKASKGN